MAGLRPGMTLAVRSLTAVLLIVAALSSIPVPAVAETFDLDDGAYQLKEGLMTLKVTIENKQITSIEVLEHRGRDEYLEKVRPLIAQIVSSQSLQIDGVTGATLSSTDLINALKQLLAAQQPLK